MIVKIYRGYYLRQMKDKWLVLLRQTPLDDGDLLYAADTEEAAMNWVDQFIRAQLKAGERK